MLHPLFAAFDPRRWPSLVQRIRLADDESAAMLPVAVVGTVAFSTGLLSSIPYAHLLLTAWCAPWLIVSSIGATLAMCKMLQFLLSKIHCSEPLKTW